MGILLRELHGCLTQRCLVYHYEPCLAGSETLAGRFNEKVLRRHELLNAQEARSTRMCDRRFYTQPRVMTYTTLLLDPDSDPRINQSHPAVPANCS